MTKQRTGSAIDLPEPVVRVLNWHWREQLPCHANRCVWTIEGRIDHGAGQVLHDFTSIGILQSENGFEYDLSTWEAGEPRESNAVAADRQQPLPHGHGRAPGHIKVMLEGGE